MVWFWLALGAVGTIGGAGMLVVAFRSGQGGDPAREKVQFRGAVAALAVGSAALLAAMIVGTPRG
ncbi:MAG TPA: hypothetical protein PLU22_05740 [Polyangiaceae bacterium]|nr:hypothetical protein [Polyangiaceae bacterium]